MIGSFRLMTTVAVLAFCLVSTVSHAQGPGGLRGRGPGGPGPPAAVLGLALGSLNLTEGQREQVRQLTQQHRQETRTLMERLRAARQAHRQALEALPVDEGRIRAAAQELAAAQTDAALARARLRSDVYALLTPDQQAQVETLKAERDARLERRRQRLQQPRLQ